MRRVRFVKSEAEIEKIRHICQITSQGFIDLEGFLRAGESEQENCRRFKQHLSVNLALMTRPISSLDQDKKGYGSIIMGPTDKIIEEGDLFIIDTGSVFDSYYCDFDRNYAFGSIVRRPKKHTG